jgi:formylglycine-generating enzyme required for sulfatase activity
MRTTFVRSLLVGFGAVLVTAVGIQASDSLRVPEGGLVGQLINSSQPACPPDMVEVPTGVTFSCVDRFEAGVGDDCPYADPASLSDSMINSTDPDCKSTGDASQPWRNISREAAMTMCAKSGKRLLTAAEWYQAALGTDGATCQLFGSTILPEGVETTCLSAAGAAHMVGNVWEWVSDDVIAGSFNGRLLPGEGYIMSVDAQGIPTETNSVSTSDRLPGYFWSQPEGAYGIIRGGFYGSGEDGSIYTTQAATKASFAGAAIGFRCAR